MAQVLAFPLQNLLLESTFYLSSTEYTKPILSWHKLGQGSEIGGNMRIKPELDPRVTLGLDGNSYKERNYLPFFSNSMCICFPASFFHVYQEKNNLLASALLKPWLKGEVTGRSGRPFAHRWAESARCGFEGNLNVKFVQMILMTTMLLLRAYYVLNVLLK